MSRPRRRRPRRRRPLRPVVEVAELHGFGPARGMWDLALACGHRVTRPKRYLSLTHRVAAPPPKAVLCRECPRGAT